MSGPLMQALKRKVREVRLAGLAPSPEVVVPGPLTEEQKAQQKLAGLCEAEAVKPPPGGVAAAVRRAVRQRFGEGADVLEILPDQGVLVRVDGRTVYRVYFALEDGGIMLLGAPEVVAVKVTILGEALTEEQKTQRRLAGITEADASFGDTTAAVDRALRAKFGGDAMGPSDEMPWICDLFTDSVIVRRAGKMFRLPFTVDDAMEAELGEPEQVQATYVPVAG